MAGSTTDTDFNSDELTQKIKDLTRTTKTFKSDLNSLDTNISNILGNSCFADGSCDASDFANFKADINNIQSSIEPINNQGSSVMQDLLTNNNLVNSSLAQLNTSYQLNNDIGRKTIDNITQQSEELQQEAVNKQRMTEINDYYTNMNTYISVVLRNLVIVLALIILVTVLSKRGLIPDAISTTVNVICILGIIVYVLYSVYDINIRDRFNFNEYVIPFDQTAEKMELIGDSNNGGFTDIRKVLGRELIGGIDEIQNLTDTCIGDSCCEPGTIYDLSSNACIIKCDSGQVYYKTTDSNGNLIGKWR